MYYGIAVEQSWLADYGKSLYPKPVPECDDFSYMAAAVEHIKRLTRIKSLAFETVYFRPNAPPDTIFYPADSGAKVVPIISVCSSYRRSFERRPTRAAFDHLLQILGGKEAIWWTSTHD